MIPLLVALLAAPIPAARVFVEPEQPQEPKKAAVELDVLILNDPDFPQVDEAAAKRIFAAAEKTIADKFGFTRFQFRLSRIEPVVAFIGRHPASACLTRLEAVRVRPGQATAASIDRKRVQDFLARWSVPELQAFFPEDRRAGLTTHESLAAKLVEELDYKIEMIRGFALPSGQSLLAPEKLASRSYIQWICSVREQDEADLILTNEFILYDLGSEPYPHTVFQKAKIGGASLASPKRQAMRGRAVVASVFSMVTPLPFFVEPESQGLSLETRWDIIGSFIVAHELGHAVFKLPDFFDHPAECLMTTKYETDYVHGYRDLLAHPGSCPACRPYVEARSHVFLADLARQSGDHAQAIVDLTEAIRLTPKHVDGNYLQYIAGLSVDVAESYRQKQDLKAARDWLKAALRIAPQHEAALRLKAVLEGPQ